MSILSDLWNKKITFSQAATEGEAWFSKIFAASAPEIQAGVSAGLKDFKQAASDAVGLADTALGPIMAAGTLAVEGAANAALKAALGVTVSGELSILVDAGLQKIADGLKAAIDAELTAVRAGLVAPPPGG